jgi:phage major head subunit gpT-like protein
MPIVKSDIAHLLLAGIKTDFFEAYDNYKDVQYEKIATVTQSTKSTETYGWLGSIPKMREWTDERIPAGLLEHSYSITNKKWESSIAVDRTALEDEQYGHIRLRVQELAQNAQTHKDELVFGMLPLGVSTVCYDGQYFFDTDHSEGDSGTQANYTTSALGHESLKSAITAMMKIKDDKGRTMGIIPDTLVVPPDLKWTAIELLKAEYNPESALRTPNVLQGALDLVVSPYLTDTNNWYLLCTKKVVKPIILQERTAPEFVSEEEASHNAVMRDQFLYGIRARYNVGYGLWQCAYAGIVS